MHEFKVGDRVRRTDNDPMRPTSGVYAPGRTGTIVGPGAFDPVWRVQLDGGPVIGWHECFIERIEPQRLVIDQLWAKLQAGGLTAQQVRAALRNCNLTTLASFKHLLDQPAPLTWMFIWSDSPEGSAYWDRLDDKFR